MGNMRTAAAFFAALSFLAGCGSEEPGSAASKETGGPKATAHVEGHAAQEGKEHGTAGHAGHEEEGKQVKAPPAGANQMCPVMPEEKADASLFVEHEGRRIYVCCKKCTERVAEDPAAWYAKAYGAGHEH